MDRVLKIATRKSPLAVWQAEFVRSQLHLYYPELDIELVKMSTQGDQMLNSPLSKIGGKSIFIKELEVGMLEGRADIAVHSMKGRFLMNYQMNSKLGRFWLVRILLMLFVFKITLMKINELPQGARVGSCSLRRIVQLKSN